MESIVESGIYAELGATYKKTQIDSPKSIGTVMGLDVTDQELRFEMVLLRAKVFNSLVESLEPELSIDFWSTGFDGQFPLDILREQALEKLVKRKVQQALLVEHGVLKPEQFSIGPYLDRWKATNFSRNNA